MQQVIVLLFVFHQLKAVWPFSSEDNTKYCRLLDIFMFFQCFSASSMDGPVGKFQWSEIFSQAHLAPTIFQNLKSPFFLIQIFALNYNRSSWPRQSALACCHVIGWLHYIQQSATSVYIIFDCYYNRFSYFLSVVSTTLTPNQQNQYLWSVCVFSANHMLNYCCKSGRLHQLHISITNVNMLLAVVAPPGTLQCSFF